MKTNSKKTTTIHFNNKLQSNRFKKEASVYVDMHGCCIFPIHHLRFVYAWPLQREKKTVQFRCMIAKKAVHFAKAANTTREQAIFPLFFFNIHIVTDDSIIYSCVFVTFSFLLFNYHYYDSWVLKRNIYWFGCIPSKLLKKMGQTTT